MNAIIKAPSPHGYSWFCTPRPAVVWIGRTGRFYPRSFELEPVQANPAQEAGVNFALRLEKDKIRKRYSFNPHYYTFDLSLKWAG